MELDHDYACVRRLDVPASSRPIWTKFKKKDAVLFERRNNSTREVPPTEVEAFVRERFGGDAAGEPS